MNNLSCNFYFLLLLLSSTCLSSEPTFGSEREILATSLKSELLCGDGVDNSRAGDPDSDSFLKTAGASIIIDNNSYYNEFTYSFIKPLAVDSLKLHSAQQMVGEGGVIFIAEVEGDLSSFATKVNAKKSTEDDDLLGVQNVKFYKTLKEKISADADPEFTKIVIGQNRIQKAQGRFFYGCIITMDLG